MAEDPDGPLLIEPQAEGVVLLTLNRPAVRNALDVTLIEALGAAFDRLRGETEWRAAVLTGVPPAFCSGLDLKAFSAPDAPRHRATDLINSLPRLGKPIIAAVNGPAVTGGLEVALACDFVIASESARFADTHVRIGALSGSGMGARLPHAVGLRRAKQMILTGEPVDAATALQIGLVNEVVAPDELLPRALALARAIARHDPTLVAAARAVLDQGSETTLGEALQIEREALARLKAERGMAWKA